MEALFLGGELMVRERRGFQKVYDLTDNVLPSSLDLSPPTARQRGHFYVRRMLAAQGLAQARDIGYARQAVKRLSGDAIQPDIDRSLSEMVESGEVTGFSLNDADHYCLTDQLANASKKLGRRRIKFLSPFDNLVINRRRLKELFDFDYQLECYVPGPKRKFGYFTQPMLYGDELIGRMDCKAERKSGRLLINNIWLESDVRLRDGLIDAMTQAINTYASKLGCDHIAITTTDNKALRQSLESGLMLN